MTSLPLTCAFTRCVGLIARSCAAIVYFFSGLTAVVAISSAHSSCFANVVAIVSTTDQSVALAEQPSVIHAFFHLSLLTMVAKK